MLSDLKIVLWYAGHQEVSSQFTFVRYLFDQTLPCPMSHSGTEMNRVRGQRSEAVRTRLVGIILQIS
jgi:hypothetical protein